MLTGLMSSAHSRLPLMKPEPCSLVRIRPTRKPTVKMRTSSTPPATEVPPVPETPKSHAPLASAAEGRLCARFEQADHRLGRLRIQLHVSLREHANLGVFCLDVVLLERALHRLERIGIGDDFPTLAVVTQVFPTVLKHQVGQLVFRGRRL